MLRHAVVLVPALAFLAMVPGCKKKHEPSKTITYWLTATDASLVGARIGAFDQKASFAKEGYTASGDPNVTARISLPRTGPSGLAALAIELDTPCGTTLIPLIAKQTSAEEEVVRKSPYDLPFSVEVKPKEPLPARTTIWLDGSKENVKVGSLDLVQGKNTVFNNLTCGPKPKVMAAGTELGTLEVAPEAKDVGVFVTAKNNACYSYEGVAYGGDPSTRRMFKGKHLYELSHGNIEHFLARAPSTKSGTSFVFELLEVPCSGP